MSTDAVWQRATAWRRHRPSRWVVRQDRLLVLALREGDEILPTAQEIFQTQFRGDRTIRGVGVLPPSEDLPNLVFSSVPADIRFEATISADSAGSPRVILNVLALVGGESRPLQPDQVEAGHAVLDGAWVPLLAGAAEEVADFGTRLGTALPGALTLADYLRVATDAARPIPLSVDEGASFLAASLPLPGRDVPTGFKGDLRPYQVVGYRWLRLLADQGIGGILGDEMGLGKTVQLIALLASMVGDGARPHLVVAPATLLENWRREVARFAPDLSVLVHQGSRRTGFPQELQAADVVVSSYETVVQDQAMLRTLDWKALILDEAQAIKNPSAERSQAVRTLRSSVRVAVSGTPVENRLSDLWSLLDFGLPGHLGPVSEFRSTYPDTPEGAASLEPTVSPFILRRTVDEAATDLPARLEYGSPLQMGELEAEGYEDLRVRLLEKGSEPAQVLAALTRLRQYCAHPDLLVHSGRDMVASSAKYGHLVDALSEVVARGHKALIFSEYRRLLELAESDLSRRLDVRVFRIDGTIPVSLRQQTVDDFERHAGAALMLLNPVAGGTGLNITAANHVFHYTLPWNPAREDQATARAWRRGQRRPVHVHRLFYANTVEERVEKCLSAKRELADAAIVGTAGGLDLKDMLEALHLSPTVC